METIRKRLNPGLTEAQKKQLAALAKKHQAGKKITAYEEGRLAAFVFFGDKQEAGRAQAILTKAKNARKGKT